MGRIIIVDNLKNAEIIKEKVYPKEQIEEYKRISDETDKLIKEARKKEGRAYIKAKYFIAR